MKTPDARRFAAPRHPHGGRGQAPAVAYWPGMIAPGRQSDELFDLMHIFNTSLRPAPWLFNLYIDPKEQYPVGHRMNAFRAWMAREMKGDAATFRKYPPKDIGSERAGINRPIRKSPCDGRIEEARVTQ